MRFTSSAPHPPYAVDLSGPHLTHFLQLHGICPTPTAHTANVLHALLHAHSYTMQVHKHRTAVCVGTHRLFHMLSVTVLTSLQAIALLLVITTTLPLALLRAPSQPPCPPTRASTTHHTRCTWQYVHHTTILMHLPLSLASLDCVMVPVSCTIMYLAYLASLSPLHPLQPKPPAITVSSAMPDASSFIVPHQVSHASPPLPASVTSDPPQADTVTPAAWSNPRPMAPQNFRVARTGDVLTRASYNMGGPEITLNRLCHALAAFDHLPDTISLQEFQPASSYHVHDFERVALHWGFHLLHSSPTTKEGVALLIHSSISPKAPPLKVHIPGTLISTELRLHPDPLVPPINVASFYRPHTIKGTRLCEPILERLLQDSYLVMGDFNGNTHSSHTTTLCPNLWPWLIAKDKAKSLVDLLLPQVQGVPYTRVQRFGGTKSYIDRAYGTRLYDNSFLTSSARVIDFTNVHGSSDHDPIIICTIPWTSSHTPEPRCSLWNRRDVNLFMSLVSKHDVPSPVSPHDVEHTYRVLTEVMLQTMTQVNTSKLNNPRPPVDVSDWAQVVIQLARQAKRRSKIFYRRIKHTLLSPPVPSILPVPSRKIQRILQGNNPWSANAPQYIPRSPSLPDVAPPNEAELRGLARAARKKSPGPDGVHPYLIAILPDAQFQVVHRCLELCYESGHIPHPWLISETFCIFKGKGSWQDPDRWRPIAMSISVYRLLMRWVSKKPYPLISPHLRPRQFGGKRGVSTEHATQAFLNDMDDGTPWEAIYVFEVYHAFDSPPKVLISTVLAKMGTPTKLLRLIQTVLEFGATYIRGSPAELFGTTHGVEQGCPLSCFLFVVVFEIPLRLLQLHGIRLSAFVDDISSPIAPSHGLRTAALVQQGLALIGCQLNVTKSESLQLIPFPLTPPSLPK